MMGVAQPTQAGKSKNTNIKTFYYFSRFIRGKILNRSIHGIAIVQFRVYRNCECVLRVFVANVKLKGLGIGSSQDGGCQGELSTKLFIAA